MYLGCMSEAGLIYINADFIIKTLNSLKAVTVVFFIVCLFLAKLKNTNGTFPVKCYLNHFIDHYKQISFYLYFNFFSDIVLVQGSVLVNYNNVCVFGYTSSCWS